MTGFDLVAAERFVGLAALYTMQLATSAVRPPPAEAALLEVARAIAPEEADPARAIDLAGRRVLEALAAGAEA